MTLIVRFRGVPFLSIPFRRKPGFITFKSNAALLLTACGHQDAVAPYGVVVGLCPAICGWLPSAHHPLRVAARLTKLYSLAVGREGWRCHPPLSSVIRGAASRVRVVLSCDNLYTDMPP